MSESLAHNDKDRSNARRCALLLLFASLSAAAQEHFVAAGQSIQQTLDRAAPNDTVIVSRAIYRENLVINKPLTLRGLQRPTIDGQYRNHIVLVAAPKVTIEGFVLRRSGDNLTDQHAGIYADKRADGVQIRRNQFAEVLFGIWIENNRDAHVEDNVITGLRDRYSSQRGNGIQLYNSSGARIVANHVSFVRDGIYVDVSHHALFARNRLHDLRYGTHYMNSNNNILEDNESFHNRGGLALMEVKQQVVRRNTVWGNSDHGIMLRTITDAVVTDNLITNNTRGVFMYDAEYNRLDNNTIRNNQVGLHIWAGSINNQFNNNDIIHNREQVKYIASRDQVWGREHGNYWSNHIGWDRDGNGVGDQPFVSQDAIDRLLWRTPSARLLLNSPALETLHHIAAQFPILRSPSIVEQQPRMQPLHAGRHHHE